MHWSLEHPFATSHICSARSNLPRVGCVLPVPTWSCQRLPGDTPACTRGGSQNPLYLQGILTTFWVPRCLQRKGESEKLRRGAMSIADEPKNTGPASSPPIRRATLARCRTRTAPIARTSAIAITGPLTKWPKETRTPKSARSLMSRSSATSSSNPSPTSNGCAIGWRRGKERRHSCRLRVPRHARPTRMSALLKTVSRRWANAASRKAQSIPPPSSKSSPRAAYRMSRQWIGLHLRNRNCLADLQMSANRPSA